MNHSFLSLVIYMLATFRLTRLVTSDSITAWFREFMRGHAFSIMEKRNTWTNTVEETKAMPKPSPWLWLWTFVNCAWCVSIWTGGLTVALAHYQGSWWNYVCYALSLSTVAGFLHSMSERF